MYHYAGNNPIVYSDPDGRIAFCAVTAIIGAGIGAGIAAYNSYKQNGKIDCWKVLEGAAIGGAVGLGLGLIGAQCATATALQSGNCLASFSAVTGFGATSTTTTAAAGETIWALDKFARGWEAERQLNGMGNNFPTIDKFVQGIGKFAKSITSIKSMDLACKTYQSASNIIRTIGGYVDKLANFTSTSWNNISVNVNGATQRFLEIAIPGNATQEQINALQQAATQAAEKGVQIIYQVIK